MAHRSRGLLVITIALAIISGCVSSSTENLGAAPVIGADERVSDFQLETKVGIIDMMEVLKRTTIGQPALVRWKREVEELNRSAYDPRSRKPWGGYKALGAALALILPEVETVTETLAEKHGLAVVLQKGTSETIMITYYSAEKYDLTEQVIEELNRRHP
jgi:hypothetical protein